MKLHGLSKEPKPRFSVGDHIDHLLITRYVGFVSPEKQEGIARRHTYECLCNCGNTRIVTQPYLVAETASEKACKTCVREAKIARDTEIRRERKAREAQRAADSSSERFTQADVLRLWGKGCP